MNRVKMNASQHRPKSSRPMGRLLSTLLPALALLAPLLASQSASAGRYSQASLIQRRGMQIDGMVGVSACMPGRSKCRGATLGRTGPLVGAEVNAGLRVMPYLFLGAGYSLGFFNPASARADAPRFVNAHQHTIVAVIRGILPAGRFDFGIELSPGWSRQKFKADDRTGFEPVDEYSQGFALRPGASISLWITRSLFLGVKADAIVNMHREICFRTPTTTMCRRRPKRGVEAEVNRASIHQFLAGLHIGGTF